MNRNYITIDQELYDILRDDSARLDKLERMADRTLDDTGMVYLFVRANDARPYVVDGSSISSSKASTGANLREAIDKAEE